jgi:hypothetical protein
MTQRRGIRNSRFLAVLLKYFARVHIWVVLALVACEPARADL